MYKCTNFLANHNAVAFLLVDALVVVGCTNVLIS